MIKKIILLFALCAFSFNVIHANQDDVNAIVCASAQDTYQKINENWKYVAADGILSTESEYWEAKWIQANANTNSGRVPTLILKSNPAHIVDALIDLINKPAALECAIALTTAKLLCLKEIMGEDKFKEYAFRFHHILNFTDLSNIESEEFFHELPLQFITPLSGTPIPGSIAYITNIKQYRDFKPNGTGTGSNLFCISSNEYMGFSQIYKDGAKPINVIEQQDFELFCKIDDVERLHKKHEILAENFKNNYDEFIEIRRKQQIKDFNFYQIFDETKIKEFTEEGAVEY
ncbi:MAG: hypothetical protein Q8S31_10630 [Alphaproteobacteria bacterium]|nr:hypothetical protein [Alphaproteobacteria bacterium]